MGVLEITRKDIIWSYIAKFFQIGAGFITLPLILRLLSSEEIGMNYLMLTISSMVALLDFGFSPQFGRNFTYVYSGASRLLKQGVEYSSSKEINYHLLSVLLYTARYVYKRLSLLSFVLMITFGSLYIFKVTNGFQNVNHAFLIWILFSISTFFNIYYAFYNSLLTGSGLVAEANKAAIYSKLCYFILCILLLLLNWGLFAVVVANFISPFVQRAICYKVYFTKDLKRKLDNDISKAEIKETFSTIWFNAKKLGVNFIGAYIINKSSMFIVGFYLPLTIVGSYGVMIQILTILSSIAQTLFLTYQPKFSNCRVSGDLYTFKKTMSQTLLFYWVVMIVGGLLLFYCAPSILGLIHSKTTLPESSVVLLYTITIILEGNHSMFATLIVTKNEVPFVKPAIVSGGIIILLTVLCLQYTHWDLIGVVAIQFLVQLAYNNWKWPVVVLKELNFSAKEFFDLALVEFNNKKNDKCK